jgi:hypothetical protein
MKPGTVVQLPDGRVGTVVYHGLDGYGIKWGRRKLSATMVESSLGTQPLLDDGEDHSDIPQPEAMLRSAYPSAALPCVGESYKVIS